MKTLTDISISPRTRGRGLSDRGITLMELVIGISIVAILVNVSFPVAVKFIRRANAVQAITDFEVIRNGVFSYHATNEVYPASSSWGTIPRGLETTLPADFEFKRKGLTYRWRRWSLPDGTPRNRKQVELMGLQIRSDDRALLAAIRDQWEGRVTQVRKNRITLVVL